MQGKGLEKDAQDPYLRGLQPRVFDYLFALTSQEKKESDVEYLIRCSYLEIYNEQIMDLVRKNNRARDRARTRKSALALLVLGARRD